MLGPPLTPRERAVLAAVERRRTNPEIASELFISVRTVESHIASLRRKLGADSRAELRSAAQDEREASVRIPANPLRGRGRDLVQLGTLLREHRRVTIVGPGGVGKTRLALEYARADSDRIPLIVELEHAQPDGVARHVARALDYEGAPDEDLVTPIGIALGAQPYVLVLDNADRVGAATAVVVDRLTALAPEVRIIVTARTPLGDPAEVVHALSPLATGGLDAPATTLLLDRLAAAGCAVDSEDLLAADRICTRLDGLPLALELAASAARHLSLSRLDDRLARDLGTLDRASPDGRHRNLATTFEWTWDLLTPAEQDALRRLAALPRTFDFELAEAVCGDDVDGVVMRLLDRSLLVPLGGDPVRFRLLAVTREFVHSRTDAATTRDVLERHAACIARVAGDFIARARLDMSPTAAQMSAVLCPEVNAALRWSLAARYPAALSLARDLAIGVEQYGSDADSISALASAAVDDAVLAAASAQSLLQLGNALAFYDIDLVASLAGRALDLAEDDRSSRAAHELAGLSAAYGGDTEAALRHLAEAERLATLLDEDWELGSIRQFRGIALRGDSSFGLETALDAFESAMRAFSRAGDETHVNNVRYMMAFAAAESDDPTDRVRAESWARTCAEHASASFNEHELAHARLVLTMLGSADAEDPSELVTSFRHLGDLRCLHRALVLDADRAADPRTRVTLLREAIEIAQAASDRAREISALERLVAAQHAANDRPATLASLDSLGRLAGRPAADEACPIELRGVFATSPA